MSFLEDDLTRSVKPRRGRKKKPDSEPKPEPTSEDKPKTEQKTTRKKKKTEPAPPSPNAKVRFWTQKKNPKCKGCYERCPGVVPVVDVSEGFEIREGFAPVKKCGVCNKYKSDYSAAIAWGRNLLEMCGPYGKLVTAPIPDPEEYNP